MWRLVLGTVFLLLGLMEVGAMFMVPIPAEGDLSESIVNLRLLISSIPFGILGMAFLWWYSRSNHIPSWIPIVMFLLAVIVCLFVSLAEPQPAAKDYIAAPILAGTVTGVVLVLPTLLWTLGTFGLLQRLWRAMQALARAVPHRKRSAVSPETTDSNGLQNHQEDSSAGQRPKHGVCTRCGRNIVTTQDEFIAKCQSHGIDIWGDMFPQLDVGGVTAMGWEDIYRLLLRAFPRKAELFASFYAEWAPWQCGKCGGIWCNECVNGHVSVSKFGRGVLCDCSKKAK